MEALFPFHPKLVHFPIALGLTGVALTLVGLLARRERLTECGRLSLLLAWIGAVIAALTGLIDQDRASNVGLVANAINQHITAGIAVIVVLGLAVYVPIREHDIFTRRKFPRTYAILLVIGAVLLVLEGWLGGRLVYHFGVGIIP